MSDINFKVDVIFILFLLKNETIIIQKSQFYTSVLSAGGETGFTSNYASKCFICNVSSSPETVSAWENKTKLTALIIPVFKCHDKGNVAQIGVKINVYLFAFFFFCLEQRFSNCDV